MKGKEAVRELDHGQMPNLETGFVASDPMKVRVTFPPHTYEGEITGFWRGKEGGTACLTVKGATVRIGANDEIEKI